MSNVYILSFIILSLAPQLRGAEEWPDYRGPEGNGHAQATLEAVPSEWSETKHLIWKVPVHDRGWSSPILCGDKVWLTAASEDGKKLYGLAFDRGTGKTVFDELLYEISNPEPLGNPVNTYASPSPTTDGERVFLHFGSYGTVCFDNKTLKQLWERRDFPCRHFRGPGSSPVLFEDLLILTFDGVDFQYLVALNKKTGETVWRRDRSTAWNDLEADGKPKAEGDYRKAYYTPSPVKVGEQWLLIAPGAKACWAYDIKTGEEIWQIPYEGFSGASRTVIAGGLAFINSGYSKPEVYAVKLDPSAKGDIASSHIVWSINKRTPNRSSPIVVDDLLYMVTDGGVLSAFETSTGELVWSQRLEGQFSASPMAVNGLLYWLSEQGVSYVIKPGRAYEAVHQNLLESGTLACPAAGKDGLYIRSKTHLYLLRNEKPN